MRRAAGPAIVPRRLALRRLRAAPGVPVALAAVLTVVAALIGLVGGAGSVVLDASVRSAVAGAGGFAQAVQVSAREATAGPARQDGEVRRRLATALGDAAGPVRRSWQGELLPLLAVAPAAGAAAGSTAGSTAGADGVRLVPWAAADLADRAVLVGGRWPAPTRTPPGGPLEATLQADAADALGVHPGDRLTLGATDATGARPPAVVVVGTWRPRDPADPSWLADPLVQLRRTRIGVVFQTFGLVPILSAAENVGVPMRLVGTPSAERERRVAELLEVVGLADHAAQRPSELSGGQQQRVAVARALANRPDLLVADEPTGQLDSHTGRAVMDLLRGLVHERGLTAVVATHDPALVALADDVVDLRDGHLLASV